MKKLILMLLAVLVGVMFLVVSCSGPIAGQAIGDKCTKDSHCGTDEKCVNSKCALATTETSCADGKDNDGDKYIYCKDQPDCIGQSCGANKKCYQGACILQQCGNNKVEGSEFCDGTNLKDKTCASVKGVNYVGTLSCNSKCDGLVTIGCTITTVTEKVNVTEKVRCVFKNSTTEQVCYSSVGKCAGVGTCVIDVKGERGAILMWETNCDGSKVFTKLDGTDKIMKFDCRPPTKETNTKETNCADGKDDDNDGLIDCADSDCFNSQVVSSYEYSCLGNILENVGKNVCKGKTKDTKQTDCSLKKAKFTGNLMVCGVSTLVVGGVIGDYNQCMESCTPGETIITCSPGYDGTTTVKCNDKGNGYDWQNPVSKSTTCPEGKSCLKKEGVDQSTCS